MCGISGYFGDRAGIDERALLHAMRHRGPDAQGQAHLSIDAGAAGDASRDGWQGGTRVFLGFARLSILDLTSAGNQPMSTEDGAATLIYNGETYNYAELRQDLLDRGHRFRSASDSEVVLRGYRQWGAAVVERMRGMFAFAVWDAEQRRLLLCRDRLGIKPLYYHYDGRRLAFASELRTLLAGGAAPRRLDPQAVHGYLALGSVPQPRTMLAGVNSLLPGHLLTLNAVGGRLGTPQERPYFTLPVPAARRQSSLSLGSGLPGWAARQDAAAQVAPVLHDAVKLRLVADVPVGVLLSGGIDSTAVALLARRASPGELHTFTLSYGPDQRESEGAEAGKIAALLGTRHHEKIATPATILAGIPAYLAAVDQPSVDGLNTYLVAQVVREVGLKVALSGLGGDELFLGYDLRRSFAAGMLLGAALARVPGGPALSRLWRGLGWQQAPLWLDKGASLLGATLGRPDGDGSGAGDRASDAAGSLPLRLYAALRSLFPAAQLGALLSPELGLSHLDPAAHIRCDLDADQVAHLPSDELLSYLELANYLPNTLLRDADVMSMVHGVELRVPLCDHALVSQVMALPAGVRVAPGRKKPLLLDAVRSPQLSQAAGRRKRGFVLPLESWLGSDLRHQVGPVLRDPALCRAAGLRPAAVALLWSQYLAGRSPRTTWRIWALFTLLSWVRFHGVEI